MLGVFACFLFFFGDVEFWDVFGDVFELSLGLPLAAIYGVFVCGGSLQVSLGNVSEDVSGVCQKM